MRIDLEQSRKQAKELLRAFRAGDAGALDRIRWNHPRFRGLADEQIRAGRFVLADAQLVVARTHYFEGWPELVAHVESVRRADPAMLRFESAADAIVDGDVEALRALLTAHPGLAREHSARGHRAPLLHYVSANGVEGDRQRSPANAVEVATLLLDAGAEVDATSTAYGGGWTALGLVATSTPPRRAGVQLPLMDLLIERGASLAGPKPDLDLVMGALANGCPEAARALFTRGAPLGVAAAAGVGDVELVREKAGGASSAQIERALVVAAQYGTLEVLRWLLDQGVSATASDRLHPLHWAAARGRLDMVDLLLERGADLEARNGFGGTTLASTIWFAYHGGPDFERVDYASVIAQLIERGARTDVYPQMRAHLEEIRGRTAPPGGHA